MQGSTHGDAPRLLSWQEALDEALAIVDDHGWRMRVSSFRSPFDNRWHYAAMRAGRRAAQRARS
jgi:hypothetical protein